MADQVGTFRRWTQTSLIFLCDQWERSTPQRLFCPMESRTDLGESGVEQRSALCKNITLLNWRPTLVDAVDWRSQASRRRTSAETSNDASCL